MKRPCVLDLFAGAGGMSLGFESAGFDVAVSVEFDPIHCATHEFNFPYTKTICKEISLLTFSNIFEAIAGYGISDLDVIVGGPPCQGFSQIGKRQINDPRNSLVFQYLRIIRELNPKYFVFENVPGIARGKHYIFLQELIAEFEKIDYKVITPYKVLNAADFGVPQNRQRLILIGARKDQKLPSYPTATFVPKKTDKNIFLFTEESHSPTASEAISDLKNIEVFTGIDDGIDHQLLDYTGFRQMFSLVPTAEYHLCHRRSTGNKVWNHIGSKHTKESVERFTHTPQGQTEPISRFFKLHPDKQCNTLRAVTNSDMGAFTAPRPIHYSLPRCISVREAARIHSFPDWFVFHKTIWHGFRQIGNSVAPLFGRRIAQQIIKLLEYKPELLNFYELDSQNEKLLTMNMSEAASYYSVDRNIIPPRKRLIGT